MVQRVLLLATGSFVLACAVPSSSSLQRAASRAETNAAQDGSASVLDVLHVGPDVIQGEEGPARFAGAVYEAFQTERAFEAVAFADRYYREPGSDGYEATLDYLQRGLQEAGYGRKDGFALEVLEHEGDPGWAPRSAELALRVDGESVVLHAFDKEVDRDRTMLPRNAPTAKLEGPIAFDLSDIEEGAIYVTRSPLRRDLLNRAAMRGAACVISASLGTYNVDPTGAERHLDAIQYRVLRFTPAVPVAQISPRSFERIQAARQSDPGARLAFECEVVRTQRPIRTLVATLTGSRRPQEAVTIVSHVQEPGACDNASGAAGLLESARLMAELVGSGKLTRPARSLVFIFGDEMVQSSIWLESTRLAPVAAISSDMTGQSREKTGAIALLERMPDPGAVEVLPPDEHTPWGASPVEAASLEPNGLNLIARCALADVAMLSEEPWETAEHPWEGGSDHDVFIEKGVPAVLFWHFTDFAYHTSLDRMSHVDPEEMRRTAAAILATALAIADPQAGDLDRYLQCLAAERRLRLEACEEAEKEALAELWSTWCTGARMWLRDQCLGLTREPATPNESKDEDR